MPSQPKMFNVGIEFDRSNDYGIKKILSTEKCLDNKIEQENFSSSNSINYPSLHKTNINAGSNNNSSKSVAKFSIGAGLINNGYNYLRECDNETSIKLTRTQSIKSDALLCKKVHFNY